MALSLLAAAIVGLALHKPQLGLGMLIITWGISILTFRQPGYAPGYPRITGGVLVTGVLFYVMYRFVFHAA